MDYDLEREYGDPTNRGPNMRCSGDDYDPMPCIRCGAMNEEECEEFGCGDYLAVDTDPT